MRTRLAVAVGTALLALVVSGLAATPASAQSVTFTLAGGTLSIAEPSGAAALTPSGALTGLTGVTVSGSLGSTLVTDDRGGVVAWNAKITGTTAFTNGTTTIAVSAAKAFVPAAITVTGTVVATSGTYLTASTGLALTNAAQNLVTTSAIVGNNTATFNPSLSITVPGDATAGAYTGAVTQTVS